MKWVKAGLIMHGFMSVIMTTNSLIMPSSNIFRNTKTEEDFVFSLFYLFKSFIIGIFDREWAIIQSFFWLCVTLWLFANDFVMFILGLFVKLGGKCCKSSNQVKEKYTIERKDLEFLKEVRIDTLQNLVIKKEKDLEEFKKKLNNEIPKSFIYRDEVSCTD